MRAAAVDAVLLSRLSHGFGVSGARRIQVSGSGGGSPWVVVLQGALTPHVFTPDPDGIPAWIPAAAVSPLRWDPVELARAVAAICRRAAHGSRRTLRIAYDVLSVGMLERLARELPGARFEDAEPLLATVHGAKSLTEISALRAAAAKARRAAGAAGAALRPGCRLADAEAAAYEQMGRDGIGFPLAEIGLWGVRPEAPAVVSRRADALGLGARLIVDVVLSDGGICGRAIRTFICGRDPTAEEEALGRRWGDAVDALARALRPGCGAAELRQAIAAVVSRESGPPAVDLFAHGVGVGIEPPFVRVAGEAACPPGAGTPGASHGDPCGTFPETRLPENAVVVVAPKVVLAGAGVVWASETVVVGRDGGSVLGPGWRPWSAS
jgi:Xaa-Pro aminopeptidase